MKILKVIALGALLLAHGISFCAEAQPERPANLPGEVTLKCTDGPIPNVSVKFLVDNFGYFDAYFRNWGIGRFAYTGKEAEVKGTVQDMQNLLNYVTNPTHDLIITNYSSVFELADELLLQQEARNAFLARYRQKIKEEVYNEPAYKKSLKDGDVPVVIRLDKSFCFSSNHDMTVNVPEDFFYSISPDGHYGITKSYFLYDFQSLSSTKLFPDGLMRENTFFSPDNRFILNADFFNYHFTNGKLFSIQSKQLLGEISGSFSYREFSPDGKWLMVIKPDEKLSELWDTKSMKIKTFESDRTVSRNNFFSLDSTLLAILSDGVNVFNLNSKEQIKFGEGFCFQPQFSFDNKKIGFIQLDRQGWGNKLKIYDLITKELLYEKKDVQRFFFKSDGSGCVLEYDHYKLYDFDTINNKEIFIDSGFLCAISSSHRFFVFRRSNGENILVDVKKMEKKILNSDEFFDSGMIFDNEDTLIAQFLKNKITIIDVSTGSALCTIFLSGISSDSEITSMEFGSNGKFLILGYTKKNSYPVQFIINLPSLAEKVALKDNSGEEQYLYLALKSHVKDVGHKLDVLNLPEKLEIMFDQLPTELQKEILTPAGWLKRDLIRDVKVMYRSVKSLFGVTKQTQQAQFVAQEPVHDTKWYEEVD